ncbi:MAG: hypothetical protein AB1938_28580 [Myxococcota bacterium]
MTRRGLAAVVGLLVVSCQEHPPVLNPPVLVDCQPILQRMPAAFEVGILGQRPPEEILPGPSRWVVAGQSARLTFVFAEAEGCPVDLGALTPKATAFLPDNSQRALPVSLVRHAPGSALFLADVGVRADVPGWWMVELALDPGWAHPQQLVYAIEDRSNETRAVEQVGGDIRECRTLQRTPGGTFVCGLWSGTYIQLRTGIAPGPVGQSALVVGDVAWATDGARVVRFVDSPTGLRFDAEFSTDLQLVAAERDVALVSGPHFFEGDASVPFQVVRHEDGGLVGEARVSAAHRLFLVNGALVNPCPGPACDGMVLGRHGDAWLVLSLAGGAALVPVDGGAPRAVDLGGATLFDLAPTGAIDVPVGLKKDAMTAVLHMSDGGVRPVYLGGQPLGGMPGAVFLRGAGTTDVVVAPLTF